MDLVIALDQELAAFNEKVTPLSSQAARKSKHGEQNRPCAWTVRKIGWSADSGEVYRSLWIKHSKSLRGLRIKHVTHCDTHGSSKCIAPMPLCLDTDEDMHRAASQAPNLKLFLFHFLGLRHICVASFSSQVKALPAHYEDCHGDDWEFRYSWSPDRVELLGTDGEVVKTWSSGESGDVIQLFASALYGSDGLEFAALLGRKPQVKKGKVSKSRYQQRVEFVVHKLQGTMGLQFTSFDFQSIVGKKARKIKSHCDFTGEVLFEDERLPQVKSEAVELMARSCDLAKVEKDEKHNAIILTFNDFLCNSAANLDMQCFVWQCASNFEISLECSWSAEAPSSQVLHICALDFCNLCIGCRRFGS